MARRVRHLIALCLAQLVLPIGLRGQQTPAFRRVAFHITDLARVRGLHHGVFDAEGRLVSSVPLRFKSSGLSDLYTYEGPMPIVFFEEKAAPTPEDPTAVIRTPVARVQPPEGADKLLLIFYPDPGAAPGGERIRIFPVDLGPGALPAGHLTIYNSTPLTLLGAVGRTVAEDRAHALKVVPGLNRPVPVSPRATLLIAVETQEEDLLRLYENTFDCDARQRLLFILFPPRIQGSPHFGGKLIQIPAEDSGEATVL